MPLLPEDGGSGLARASRRRVRLTLLGATVTVIAGLVAIVALVLGALAPQLTELARIGGEHARAVATAAHLRDHLAALRLHLSMPAARGAPGPGVEVASELRALESDQGQLEALCRAEEELGAVRRMRAALRRVETAAWRAERERASGGEPAAAGSLQELADVEADLTRASDGLVGFNAQEVLEAASGVHASLLRAMVASTALALLVMAAALALLRHALSSMEAHERLRERQAEDLSSFASRAAHELRTPLHTIGLALHVLRRSPGQASALERAEGSARRLSQTIDDILRFSRSGGAPQPGAASRVGAVIEAVVAELGPRAAEAGLALRADAPGDLEAAMEEGHLRTVVQNLVENAIKYGRSPEGRVTVRAWAQGGRAILAVADTGPGIPAAALPHVFEPFFRAGGGEGYGLGLPTVKRLVEAHGGEVRLASGAGGTTVTVELPRPVRARDREAALPP